jgi:hypothetical protein
MTLWIWMKHKQNDLFSSVCSLNREMFYIFESQEQLQYFI